MGNLMATRLGQAQLGIDNDDLPQLFREHGRRCSTADSGLAMRLTWLGARRALTRRRSAPSTSLCSNNGESSLAEVKQRDGAFWTARERTVASSRFWPIAGTAERLVQST